MFAGHRRNTAWCPMGAAGRDSGRAALYRYGHRSGAAGNPAAFLRKLCEGGSLYRGIYCVHIYPGMAGAEADRKKDRGLPDSDTAVYLCGCPALRHMGDYRGAFGICHHISVLYQSGEEEEQFRLLGGRRSGPGGCWGAGMRLAGRPERTMDENSHKGRL